MDIYSGKCRLGKCGRPTGKKDMVGDELFVGDIVMTFTSWKDDDGHTFIEDVSRLTAVVDDMYTSYSDGEHRVTNETPEAFVMGIRSVDFESGDNLWNVKKLKDHSDVVAGEKWTAWGFHYEQETPND